MVPRFVKVMPKDYKRVLQSIHRVKEAGLAGEDAIMAFTEDGVEELKNLLEMRRENPGLFE